MTILNLVHIRISITKPFCEKSLLRLQQVRVRSQSRRRRYTIMRRDAIRNTVRYCTPMRESYYFPHALDIVDLSIHIYVITNNNMYNERFELPVYEGVFRFSEKLLLIMLCCTLELFCFLHLARRLLNHTWRNSKDLFFSFNVPRTAEVT